MFPLAAGPKEFYYRRRYDAALSELAPYSPHPIVLGSHVYGTAAHLYWTLAFGRYPRIVKAIQALRSVADHDESVARLLQIALHYQGLVSWNVDFIERPIGE